MKIVLIIDSGEYYGNECHTLRLRLLYSIIVMYIHIYFFISAKKNYFSNVYCSVPAGINSASFFVFQATREFIEKVNAKFRRKLGPVTWSMAVRFLFARKFDVARSLALFEQHELTRQREGLTRFDPTSEPLHSELLTGKFTILVSSTSLGTNSNRVHHSV